MEHGNAGSDASQIIAAGDVASATQPPAPKTDNGGANNSSFAPSLPFPSKPLFGCSVNGDSATFLPRATTVFGAPAPSPGEAVAFGLNPSNAPPSGVFQFPPPTELQTPTFSFGRESPPCPEPASEPSLEGQGNPATLLFGAQGSSSSPSSAMSAFRCNSMSFGTSAASGLFMFPPPVAQASQTASGSNPSDEPAAFGAPAFGCSTGATRSSGFGCFRPSNSLFATPTPATTANRTSGAPSGFSFTVNEFNRGQCWPVPSYTPTWGSPRPLNVKRCYCGKVAGIRFSNKTDSTLGIFYCCPDHNEEAIRNGTQERNYCTYREWSNSFSLVRRCYCGKVAVLQKSEKFGTRDRLFYSCPEYREKDVIAGRSYRDHCYYVEWYTPPMLF